MTKLKNLNLSAQQSFHNNDITERSITPRTHVERDFSATELVSFQNTSTSHSVYDYYVDRYEHRDGTNALINKALRFGINHYQDNLKNTLDTHNNNNAKKLVAVEEQSKLSKTSKGTSTTPADPRIQQMQDLKNAGQLTDIEKNIATGAISYLDSDPNIHTVLLDIFARDSKTGQIKFEQKQITASSTIDIPEIHTVVLHKQKSLSGSNNDYLVIDPSNATFSHVLAEANDHIRLCFNKKFQLYTKDNSGSSGNQINQWRDCVDVAVKLAFQLDFINKTLGEQLKLDEIDSSHNLYKINYDALKNSHSIKAVTNQQNILKMLPEEAENIPLRQNQSSDTKIARKTTEFLKGIKLIHEELLDKLTKQDCALAHAKQKQSFVKILNDISGCNSVDEVKNQFDNFSQAIQPIGETTVALVEMENAAIDAI